MKFTCRICLEPDCEAPCWRQCLNLFPDRYTDQGRGVCETCIRNFLVEEINRNAIKGDGSIRCICTLWNCPGQFVKEDILQNAAGIPPDSLEKYKRFSTEATINDDPTKRWCPRPGCNGVAQKISSRRALCDICNLNFCAKCGSVHRPFVDCSLVSVLD